MDSVKAIGLAALASWVGLRGALKTAGHLPRATCKTPRARRKTAGASSWAGRWLRLD